MDDEHEKNDYSFVNETLSNISGIFEMDSTVCGRFRLIAHIETINYADDKEIGQFNSMFFFLRF